MGCMTEKNEKKARGRQPEKRHRIVEYVRNGVARGKFAPGGLLPDRTWFMERFGVTRATAQAAFDQLSEEGFTVAVRHKGTSVVDPPPFWNRYLLVLSGTAREPSENLFGLALADSARRLERERGVQFEVRHLLDEGIDSREYAQAIEDIRSQRYAGVFLRALSSNRGLHTFGNIDHVPTSGFFCKDPRATGSMVQPLVDDELQAQLMGFVPLLRECKRAGKTRVLIVSNALEPDLEARVRGLAREYGVECLADGYHTADTRGSDMRQLVRLLRVLLRPGAPNLPEAIVVNDDNFLLPLERVIRALYGADTNPFFVVSDGNLPRLPQTTLKVRFHGIDTYATMAGFLDWVQALHAGEVGAKRPRIALF